MEANMEESMTLSTVKSIDENAVETMDRISFSAHGKQFSLVIDDALFLLQHDRWTIDRFHNDPANKLKPLTKANLQAALAPYAPEPVAAVEASRPKSAQAGQVGQ